MYLKHRVQTFWKYFETIQTDLEHALKEGDAHELRHLLKDVDEKLKTICGCRMEAEMSETGFYELTFACGGNKNAQLAAALLKKNAPKQLQEDWIINAFRQPLSERAMHSVLSVNGKEIRGSDFKVYYTINEEAHMLDIKLYCELLKGVEEHYREQVSAYMLELFIGELEFEARINSIEILEEEGDEENFCLLPNLYEDICDLIIDRDWLEYHDPLSIYMAYKLDEKPVSETLRKDRKLIITTNPQLQEELMNKQYDTCSAFKELGGEYGYLYFEKLYEDEKEALVRQQLEKEINELLYGMSIARTMGGAVGTYYTYIDVALFDKDAFLIALEKMNEKMSFHMYYRAYMEE